MEEKNNLFLKALKYGTQHETFTFKDLSEGLNLSADQKKRLFYQINKGAIFYFNAGKGHYRESGPLYMSVEDTFRLLEYTELKEARRSSLLATRFASAALIVSIISTLASIYYSKKSMSSKINVPSSITESINEIRQNSAALQEDQRTYNDKALRVLGDVSNKLEDKKKQQSKKEPLTGEG